MNFPRFAIIAPNNQVLRQSGNHKSWGLGIPRPCVNELKKQLTLRSQNNQSKLTPLILTNLRDLMRRIRHLKLKAQVINLNRVLRGHYAYYGIAGNLRALQKVHRFVEQYWRKMLCSRSRKGNVPWEVFHRIKARFPLQQPKLKLPYGKLQALAVL